jgi:hypothetical protein
MLVYKVFYKNFELKKGEFMGVLIERRKDLRGKTQVESGLRWARSAFSHRVKDEKTIFAVPNEVKLGNDSKWLMEKGVFTKEEFLAMVKVVGQEMKR